MKAIDMTLFDHPVFEFLSPTATRINHSVAWLTRCKLCGHEQLAGSTQARLSRHTRCIKCQIKPSINNREISNHTLQVAGA